MATDTIANLIGRFYQRSVDVYFKALGAQRTTSTFDLYRRQRSGPPNDLGVPNDPYALIVNDQPCTIIGIHLTRDGSFDIVPAGQLQHPYLEMFCSLTDVRAGDNIVLALDGASYHVERSEIQGTLTYCLLEKQKAQVVP